jgi:hypothetical protein
MGYLLSRTIQAEGLIIILGTRIFTSPPRQLALL